MLLEKIKKIGYKYLLVLIFVSILMIMLLINLINAINMTSKSNQNIFAYTVKIRDSVENLDEIFAHAEINVNVMVDSISNTYDIKKQKDEKYNLIYLESINGLIKSFLSDSSSVNGAWFQLNADLPFSTYAYNWFEYRDSQFFDIKNELEKKPTTDRKICPAEDPYYFGAINNQKAVWSEIYTDADTKDAMITISAPIYKEDVLIGVVGLDILTDNLQQVLKNIQTSLGGSELFLLDNKDNVILTESFINLKQVEEPYKFIDLFEKNKKQIEYYDNLTPKTAIMLTLSNGYKLVISQKNNVLFGETTEITNIICALYFLLVLSLIIAFMMLFKLMSNNKSDQIINQATQEVEKQKIEQD